MQINSPKNDTLFLIILSKLKMRNFYILKRSSVMNVNFSKKKVLLIIISLSENEYTTLMINPFLFLREISYR